MVPLAFGIAAVVLLIVALTLRRKQRLISDLPESKVQGVFIGLVEVEVSAETEKPVTGFLSGESCVLYTYKIEEHWSHTYAETYTDDKGQSQTRTKTDEGWTLVGSGGELPPFYGKDDTGLILVRPEGAKFEGTSTFERTAVFGDPIYLSKGSFAPVPHSTGRRRFTEERFPVHAPLFIVGKASERADVVAPEISRSKDAPLFLISGFSRKVVQVGYSLYSWLAWAAGLAAAALAGHEAARHLGASPGRVMGLAVGAAALFVLAWAAGWALMVYNSLVGLRQRVRQGWSLIDVQLKRRSDLIPGLASAVAALSAHEHDVQTAVATLRAQAGATRPGDAGPDPAGLVGTVRAVSERYPQLVAQPAFAKLQAELVETEQRIALARTYYNDIATHLATRAAQLPDCWLASVAGIRPEPLLSAADFERAPVKVSLA
jgi:hypothetical protein